MKTPRRTVTATAGIILGALLWALPSLILQAQEVQVAEGDPVNIAPWGELTSFDKGKDIGLLWEDPRDVYRVLVVFKETPPDPSTVKLQWWQSQWPERRVPRDRLSGAGEAGWLHLGDWYQGQWREADAVLNSAGNIWSYSIRPLHLKEYPNLKDFPAEYRTTMKIRLLFPNQAPPVEKLEVFSDSQWKSTPVVIEWGGTAEQVQTWDGHLELFNGHADKWEALKADGSVRLQENGTWQSKVKGSTSGIRARIFYTQSPNVNSYDRTVVTVRAKEYSFSFDAAEVASGARVFAPAYGVLVRQAGEAVTYAEMSAAAKNPKEKTLYDRVFDEPEQTFARAWADMPPKRQFYIPLGCEGGRQRFGVNPNGSIFCVNDRIDHPKGKDTDRRTWGGNRLDFDFDLPRTEPSRRWIEDNNLPIIHAEWVQDGIRYTQTAFVTRLEPGGLGFPDMKADDTSVLMVKIAGHNITNEYKPAHVVLTLKADGRSQTLSAHEGLIKAQLKSGEVLRGLAEGQAEGKPVEGGGLQYFGNMPPGTDGFMVVKIPFITLDKPEEMERLRQLDYEEEFKRVKGFWKGRADASAQIHTGVEPIDQFYRAHVSHLLINCGREVGADRLMARVGSFGYGVYGNESCMMITDLDHRGLHSEAERCLEAFLHHQGSAALPGDYLSKEGVFNGAGGWESGGYNQHHGWIMWAMAEHYWFSGDAAWLNKNADKLIKACRWIINERARTRTLDPKSMRGIERGLLPLGSLEDIGDWRCWLSNNLFSWWGLDAIARALADLKHPEGKNLLAEAESYRKDLLAAFKEGMVRSPMVRLRDGSYIPVIPSEVHRRGRTFGWITTVLEGSIYLIRTGAIDPREPLAQWIMQDYEDNLYLSEQFGYSPKHLTHWFSRGGFSMQPNLLCSPHPYLMRDEIKHFLRAYFNAFTVGYYTNTQMMTEHPLPDMGDWRGDHYKSSDESNSTYWLRLMFIDERGEDLYLGMAVPRHWLAPGQKPGIERAATRFGRMNLGFEAQKGRITATIAAPDRRSPRKTFLRFRHPESKSMVRVEVNGKNWTKFDAKREWVELPKLSGPMKVVAVYE